MTLNERSKIHVRRISDEYVTWNFRESAPTFRAPPEGEQRWSSFAIELDPFPGYSHDVGLVESTVSYVLDLWTPAWDIYLYVSDREDVSRTNGCSNDESIYDYELKAYTKRLGHIFLGGKRIPPHPGMTRHLVAHEYGHHVQWQLALAHGYTNTHDEDFLRTYASLRGLPDSSIHHGDGGRWHKAAQEIFACDFRLAVCRLEEQYWPHMGFPRPQDTPIWDWWQDRIQENHDEYPAFA